MHLANLRLRGRVSLSLSPHQRVRLKLVRRPALHQARSHLPTRSRSLDLSVSLSRCLSVSLSLGLSVYGLWSTDTPRQGQPEILFS